MLSGILTAKKFLEIKASDSSDIQNGEAQECFLIELNLPTVPELMSILQKFHQFPVP